MKNTVAFMMFSIGSDGKVRLDFIQSESEVMKLILQKISPTIQNVFEWVFKEELKKVEKALEIEVNP
jgi:hypothetical protein